MLILIYNIPRQIRTKDLRVYFNFAIQNNVFTIFHFKHRDDILKNIGSKTVCCCFAIIEDKFLEKLLALFNNKNWKKNNTVLSSKCQIIPVNDENFKMIQKLKDLKLDDIYNFPELNPPKIMPQGNVGTPESYFLQQIQECRLPSLLISKLGLNFNLPKVYSNVPFKYDNFNMYYTPHNVIMKNFESKCSNSRIIPKSKNENLDFNNMMQSDHRKQTIDPITDESDEGEEEWDRHCALYNDVDKQERSKERLFESEKEVVWEKGSSGLVWYTDAAFWHDLEEGKGNIFEEQCPDDWDVDLSIYENLKSGDKDAQDLYSIHLKDAGGVDCWAPEKYNSQLTVGQKIFGNSFKQSNYKQTPPLPYNRKQKYIDESYDSHVVEGIGRSLIQKIGWKQGQGLGKGNEGIREPLPVEGKITLAKLGLGYTDTIIDRNNSKNTNKSTNSIIQRDACVPRKKHSISTVYDAPTSPLRNPYQRAMQSQPPTFVKHRLR